VACREKYKARLEDFDTTEEWERATIIFFIINSVKVKNNIFNKQIINRQNKASQSKRTPFRYTLISTRRIK